MVSQKVSISLARLAVSSLVAVVLPAYLTHHLSVTTHGDFVFAAVFLGLQRYAIPMGIAVLDRYSTASGLRILRLHSRAPRLAMLIFLTVRFVRRVVRLHKCALNDSKTLVSLEEICRQSNGFPNESPYLSMIVLGIRR
jgi:hypothetical protein